MIHTGNENVEVCEWNQKYTYFELYLFEFYIFLLFCFYLNLCEKKSTKYVENKIEKWSFFLLKWMIFLNLDFNYLINIIYILLNGVTC